MRIRWPRVLRWRRWMDVPAYHIVALVVCGSIEPLFAFSEWLGGLLILLILGGIVAVSVVSPTMGSLYETDGP